MTCIIVLGTHRTGTSLTSGILHHLGVNMGDNMKGPHPSNPSGHFEDMDFLLLNDEVVGNWKDPYTGDPTAEQMERYKAHIRSRIGKGFWGIKDPRLCITVKHFFHYMVESLGVKTKIIYPHRLLMASSKSLKRVHPMTLDEAVDIQITYLEELDKWRYGDNAKIKEGLDIWFDTIIRNPVEVIYKVVEYIEIEPTEKQIQAAINLVNPDYVHYGEENEDA